MSDVELCGSMVRAVISLMGDGFWQNYRLLLIVKTSHFSCCKHPFMQPL
ncbi:hypothetical protein BVRB_9g216100 [Beta vulgaris subsp. vulgaris]|nr:hypothetical protein BVRB_9g216100 [Beta vulgaris subsp. vulgaris]